MADVGADILEYNLRVRRFFISLAISVIAAGGGLCVAYILFCAPPQDFPTGEHVVRAGESASEIAEAFAQAHLVRSAGFFTFVLRLSGADAHVKAGTYRFDTPQNVFALTNRLGRGETGVSAIRITFPEGETVREMALRMSTAFPQIPQDAFIGAAQGKEGFLFPDTYLFSPDATPVSMVEVMRKNFKERTALLMPEIARSQHTLTDIVTMGSLIEKETTTPEDRRIVAGILWNRIKIGMPLQVDAVFGYIKNVKTYSPTFEDLAIDSPYNTYRHAGLPPGPIGNPGLDALTAALYPAHTSYLYYLTGKDGAMHYAKTFEEHKANREKYL